MVDEFVEDDGKGATLLLLACKAGHRDVAGKLLDLGADVEASRTDGMTALMLAAEHQHAEVTGLLCDHLASRAVGDPTYASKWLHRKAKLP